MTAATITTEVTLGRRVARSSAITAVGFGLSQVIRLALNVILARLLFPEAFGMMALVTVILVAVGQLSDMGIGPAIMQSKRGDDPEFLDTAWTAQLLRGGCLWLFMLAATPLLAWFYDEPRLNVFLPVAALGFLISAFNPTRLETANRHMRAGLVTFIDLATQILGALVAVVLAWAFQTIWALVVSGLAAALLQLLLLHVLLPGHRNHLAWNRQAASELFHFGKWIFLATVCGFIVSQADKMILGYYLDLGHFGIYSIALSLASLPAMLGSVVARRVLIPVYRDSPPAVSAANAARIRKLRAAALGILLVISALLVFGANWLVQSLYDSRYQAAAGLIILIVVMQAPTVLAITCDNAALALGDSQGFFWLILMRAILVSAGLFLGLHFGGLTGAIVGQGLANLAGYPVLVWLLRRHGAWDPALDFQFLGAAAMLGLAALAMSPAIPVAMN